MRYLLCGILLLAYAAPARSQNQFPFAHREAPVIDYRGDGAGSVAIHNQTERQLYDMIEQQRIDQERQNMPDVQPWEPPPLDFGPLHRALRETDDE